MKKLLKRISVMLAALMLLLNCNLQISAEGPTEGSITIWKYSPLNPGGTPGDGESGPVGDYRPIKNVEFTIYHVADWNGGEVGSGYASLIDGTTFTGSTSPIEVYKDMNGVASPYKVVTTGDTGSVTAGNLPLGLYLIAETNVKDALYADSEGGKANITKMGDPFFVSVPMSKSDGSGYLYDISIYPKNASTNVSKEADQEVVGVGDKVQYVITVGIPEYISSIERFIVTDTLPIQIDYESSGVYMDRGGNTPASTSIYELIEPDETIPSKVKVIFDVKSAELADLAGQNIYILVNTIVNKNAIVKDEITNSLSVDYGDDSPTTEIGETNYVGKITIDKVDKDTDQKLKDVQFKIYREVEGKKEYIKDPNNDTINYVVTTDENGSAAFVGLNNGTYFIEEEKAANGYQLLKEPIQVEVTDDENAPKVQVKVTNIKKFDLPITGGMGSTLFTVVGSVLIVCGLVVFFITRRKGRQENK